MAIQAGALSDPGIREGNNQDACCCDRELGLYAVADGVGKRFPDSGRVILNLLRQQLAAGKSMVNAIKSVQSGLVNVYGEKRPGAAIAMIQVQGKMLKLFWAGDSRIYRYNGQLKQLSKDHSFVQGLVDAGALNAEEANEHPKRHVLTGGLGTSGSKGSLGKILPQNGDRFLLCTDGIWSYLSPQQMCTILAEESDPQMAAQMLADTALGLGSSDNLTALVLDWTD